MKKISTYIILLSALMAGLFTSCNKWEEPEFQVPVYNGPAANHTIADIKAMHPSLGSGAQDSICRWDEPFIVKAVVVSSDEGGNCYKYMTIQDETGGIEISIDRTGLYNDYPVGQTIYLDCRGLIVGDYHNKPQIGWKYPTSVGRINQTALNRYIHKDGLPDPTNPLVANPIEITGSNQLTAENINCLVKINGCKFDSKYDGEPLANDDFTMDREVYIAVPPSLCAHPTTPTSVPLSLMQARSTVSTVSSASIIPNTNLRSAPRRMYKLPSPNRRSSCKSSTSTRTHSPQAVGANIPTTTVGNIKPTTATNSSTITPPTTIATTGSSRLF